MIVDTIAESFVVRHAPKTRNVISTILCQGVTERKMNGILRSGS